MSTARFLLLSCDYNGGVHISINPLKVIELCCFVIEFAAFSIFFLNKTFKIKIYLESITTYVSECVRVCARVYAVIRNYELFTLKDICVL